MTNEEFSRRYHLLDRLSQGPVVTHHAQSANGAMVMVHFLRGSSDENAAVIGMLDALTPERRARILTVADVDGVTTVVTKFVLDFTSLQDWLATGAPQLPPPRQDSDTAPLSSGGPLIAPSVAAVPPPRTLAEPPLFSPNEPAGGPAGSGPGEFTRLFQNVEPPAASQQARPPVAGPPPSIRDPGEFTLLFGGTPPVNSAPAVDARPAPSSPPPVASVQPALPNPSPRQQSGEFTRMFGAPTPVAPPVQESRATQSPAEAPRFVGEPVAPTPTPFDTPKPPSPRNEPIDPTFGAAWRGFPAPTPQSAPPPAGPGEYTRLFGGPAAPPMAPAPSRFPSGSPTPSVDWQSPGASGGTIGSNPDDAYFDRLVGGAAPAPAATPGFPVAPQNLPPAPPAFSGPSEFTRVISGSPLSPMLTPPAARPIVTPPPVTPVGNSRKGGDRVLLFSLVGVIVLAIVLVAVFLIVT